MKDTAVSGPGSLVVSPSIPGQPNITRFQREVNVVQWGDESVLDANVVTSVDSGVDAPFGWAQVSVSSRVGNLDICRWPNASFAPNPALALTYMSCDIAATGAVPMIGFVAWGVTSRQPGCQLLAVSLSTATPPPTKAV